MKKSTIIDIAAFVIPAILAFSSYSYGETANRIMYAIAIGLAFACPIGAITTGADAEYRKKASVSDKIGLLVTIIAFPIFYLMISSYYSRVEQYPGKPTIAWCSLLIGLAITLCISKAIAYVIKLFGKE